MDRNITKASIHTYEDCIGDFKDGQAHELDLRCSRNTAEFWRTKAGTAVGFIQRWDEDGGKVLGQRDLTPAMAEKLVALTEKLKG